MLNSTSYSRDKSLSSSTPNRLGSNYEYSLAISKCNQRLERLKNQKNFILGKKNYLNNLSDYRNFMWPLRKPVEPNPMLYAYQFIPPPLIEPQRKPKMTYPVNIPTIKNGIFMRQMKEPRDYGYTGDEMRMFIDGLNNINFNEYSE